MSHYCKLIGSTSPFCCEDFHPVLLQENLHYTKVQDRRVDHDPIHRRLGRYLLRRECIYPLGANEVSEFQQLLLLQGDPITASWNPGQGHLRWDSTALGLAQVGTSIALDVIVLCFPIPVIFGLHMRTQRKVAIALIFWVGAL